VHDLKNLVVKIHKDNQAILICEHLEALVSAQDASAAAMPSQASHIAGNNILPSNSTIGHQETLDSSQK
jgi:hypothetical protein